MTTTELLELIAELRAALKGCLDAMDMQERRELGQFHIPQQTALPIWRKAQACARALIAKAPPPHVIDDDGTPTAGSVATKP